MVKKLIYIFSKDQKKQLIIIGILLLIGMIFEMAGLGVLIPALGVILNPNIAEKYPSLNPLIEFLGNPNSDKLVIYGLSLLVIVYFTKIGFLTYLSWRQSKFSSRLGAELTSSLFKGYMTQPYSFHLQRNSSQLIKNIQTEIGQFTTLSQAVIFLTIELSVILGSALMLILLDPIGAISISVFLLLSSMTFHRLTKNKLLIWGQQRQDYDSSINKHLIQGLSAIKDVKIFGKENFFLEKYDTPNFLKAKIFTNQVTLQQLPRLYLEFLSIIGLAGLVIIKIIQNKPLDLMIPTLGVFVAAAFRMLPSVNRILSSIQGIKFTKPAVDILYHEFHLISNTKNIGTSENGKLNFDSEIRITNLSFKYEDSNYEALSDISLMIKHGESVGFLGPSGSGKSTLVDLFLGLHSLDNGQITVDGINIQECIRQWQNQIGYVPQTIYLIDDSILQNVAFGIPEDEIDLKSVKSAIIAAQLNEFIQTLPEGINTFVGERGVRLSGGQRQRIGIARALYHNPSILVLDEATSALDYETEKEVMEAVNAFQGQKTLIIVAHRLSTLENCDRLYQLERGKIIDVKYKN
uniref:ABC transporter ATP-binding protein n=1 Tax=Algoriphagus sp. TaxID=1872435 RepID=UPI0040477A97